jgi:hypothetical protein
MSSSSFCAPDNNKNKRKWKQCKENQEEEDMVAPNPLKCEIALLSNKKAAPVAYGPISRGQGQYATHAVLFRVANVHMLHW